MPDPELYRVASLLQQFRSFEFTPGEVFHNIGPASPLLSQQIVQILPHLSPTLTFLRKSPRDQAEPNYIHTDIAMGDWTGILYLNQQPDPGDGTVFWCHKQSGMIKATAERFLKEDWADVDKWEAWRTVHAKFNRLVLFPAAYFHSRAIFANYGKEEESRLIQVVFGTGDLAVSLS